MEKGNGNMGSYGAYQWPSGQDEMDKKVERTILLRA